MVAKFDKNLNQKLNQVAILVFYGFFFLGGGGTERSIIWHSSISPQDLKVLLSVSELSLSSHMPSDRGPKQH